MFLWLLVQCNGDRGRGEKKVNETVAAKVRYINYDAFSIATLSHTPRGKLPIDLDFYSRSTLRE